VASCSQRKYAFLHPVLGTPREIDSKQVGESEVGSFHAPFVIKAGLMCTDEAAARFLRKRVVGRIVRSKVLRYLAAAASCGGQCDLDQASDHGPSQTAPVLRSGPDTAVDVLLRLSAREPAGLLRIDEADARKRAFVAQ